MAYRVFGVRHHGPGSARHLLAGFASWQPDAVLVEGPPEADAILAWAGDPALEPPVAIHAYVPEEPGRAMFWPFAAFSPEWQAIRWAHAAGVPARFIDLRAGQLLCLEEEPVAQGMTDPLAGLAHAAGYADPERWWDDVIEHRPAGADPFAAIAEAMTAAREAGPPPTRRTLLREAAMRRGLRAALREGRQRVAVVCGAWHAPALLALPAAAADSKLLRGLRRIRVAVTWVPWTSQRLALASGYGAGVTSPAWYSHLFAAPGDVVTTWLTGAARLLREEDLDAPPASVVDAVRLAGALSALRGRAAAGLDEVMDAARAVLTGGSDVPLAIIAERLVVGDALGQVPAGVPMVPLQRDLTRLQRRFRLPPSAARRDLDLDLRRPTDRSRSQLLHRLLLLEVPWGRRGEVAGARGTFREQWRLRWDPDLSVRVVEASVWGTTVAAAASARAASLARGGTSLAALTELAERCLLAGLDDAVAAAMRAFADSAAVDLDVSHLMAAFPPLARVLRYGDVRGTPSALVTPVVDGLAGRVCVGLPAASLSLDDDAAAAMAGHITRMHDAISALARDDLRDGWQRALSAVAGLAGAHPLVAGRCTRLLLDAGALTGAEAGHRMALALPLGEDPARAAAWLEGFLSGSGLVLVHDRVLLDLADRWLCAVPDDRFTGVLPLLRRTFATFEPSERRLIGERIRAAAGAAPGPWAAPGRPPAGAVAQAGVDEERAAAALPTVLRLLGAGG
jgi:hypothetical protein